MANKSVGVRLSDAELLVLSRVPADNNPEAIRWLIHKFAEREQILEGIEGVGDRVIASLSSRMDSIKPPENNNLQPQIIYDDTILREALAAIINHALVPSAPTDRKQPLLQAARNLKGEG